MPRKPAERFTRKEGRAKTRSHKPRLVDETLSDDKLLKAQLAQSGLYAANTLGDGNCLFRALSDQLTGDEASHHQIRYEVCEHLSANADRYSPYIDSDSVPGGFEGHVRSMRMLGTYGTDIELTAFAHHYKRPIKVFQPGLVYVIQADDGPTASTSKAATADDAEESPLQENLTPREQRLKSRQDKLKADKGKGKLASTEEKRERARGSLYIAYHSWEHYSSVRRLQGPHSGPPSIEQLENASHVDEHTESTAMDTAEPATNTPTVEVAEAEPTAIKRRGRPKKYPPDALHPTLLSAQSIALPPSRSASPASTPPTSSFPAVNERVDSPRLRPRSSSASSGTTDSRAHQRSRRTSPQSSLDSPASSLETEDDAEEAEQVEKALRGVVEKETKVKSPSRPTRGPTAREKKEAQRRRRVELRRAKVNASEAKMTSSAVAAAGGVRGRARGDDDPNVLKVRELFI